MKTNSYFCKRFENVVLSLCEFATNIRVLTFYIRVLTFLQSLGNSSINLFIECKENKPYKTKLN